MSKDKVEQQDVIVTFNGQKHKLNDLAKMEIAAADEDKTLNWFTPTEDKSTPDLLAESDQIYEESRPIPLNKIKKKKKKKQWKTKAGKVITSSNPPLVKSFWVPILSAIIVGLGLGFTILILFSAEHNAKNPVKQVTSETTAKENKPVQGDVKGTVDGSDLGFSTEVVQAGAVSTLDKAKAQRAKLKDRGVPVIIAQGKDYYFLFIGVAKDKNQAKSVGKVYHNTVPEHYIKPWTISSEGLKVSSDTAHQAIESEKDLLMSMMTVSAEFLVNGSPSKSNLNELQKHFTTFSKINYEAVKDTEVKETAAKINNAHSLLVSSMDNPSDGTKRNLQQTLMDTMIAYNKMLSNLKQ